MKRYTFFRPKLIPKDRPIKIIDETGEAAFYVTRVGTMLTLKEKSLFYILTDKKQNELATLSYYYDWLGLKDSTVTYQESATSISLPFSEKKTWKYEKLIVTKLGSGRSLDIVRKGFKGELNILLDKVEVGKVTFKGISLESNVCVEIYEKPEHISDHFFILVFFLYSLLDLDSFIGEVADWLTDE